MLERLVLLLFITPSPVQILVTRNQALLMSLAPDALFVCRPEPRTQDVFGSFFKLLLI